ncbi:cytochrome b/b6 domain-containing protein [Colwelliaceae bacterium 6441]
MAKQYLIWDLPLRIFHWSLVITLFCLWVTSDQELGLIEYHMKFGYVALGLILFRLVWGLFGTKHAKFINFIPSLSAIKQYLRDNKSGSEKPFAGHNPLGSLMVVLFLVLILLQASTGLFIDDDIFSSGPYNGTISKELEKIFNYIHSNGFNVLLTLSVIHVFAIMYYSKVKKQPLVRAMFHGKKPADTIEQEDAITHSKIVSAVLIVLTVILFVYWLVVLNAPVVEEFY